MSSRKEIARSEIDVNLMLGLFTTRP